MAIGNSTSGFTIGGKPLGVQLGQKSATALFGDGAANANTLFSANLTASTAITISPQDIAIKGIQDQIDRIQGYRTNLSPADKKKLADYQEKIVNFNQTASTRVLTAKELGERADAYIASYAILGKEYEDFSNDSFVKAKSEELSALLASKPVGAEAKRLERLQNVMANLRAKAFSRDDPSKIPATLFSQISSVNKQIAALTSPRPISSLSRAELRQHDELVGEINDYVGFELELTSSKKQQIERLQKTIQVIQQGGGVYA